MAFALQPRSTRLRALARRSSRRAAPRNVFDLFDVTPQLIRRLARDPFVPWKALKSDSQGVVVRVLFLSLRLSVCLCPPFEVP